MIQITKEQRVIKENWALHGVFVPPWGEVSMGSFVFIDFKVGTGWTVFNFSHLIGNGRAFYVFLFIITNFFRPNKPLCFEEYE
jgi:hypothetical protein